jgi:hypothetical protein
MRERYLGRMEPSVANSFLTNLRLSHVTFTVMEANFNILTILRKGYENFTKNALKTRKLLKLVGLIKRNA